MSEQPKAAPSATRRSEASRRAILTAAFDLVGEVGYAKLTIEAIAARAGVGKQTIYRWWPSKGAVLVDAVLMLSEDRETRTAALPDTDDLARDLKTALRATVAELNDPRYDQPLRALNTEIAHDPQLAATYRERLHEPMQEIKRQRLRKAWKAGQLDTDIDLDVAIDLLWGPLLNRWLLRTGPLTEEYADRIVDTALGGLNPRSWLLPGRL
ncbi:TetR/AcrR family transcriptional regulator [Solihabitans fulvus]|uniref:TetR/AcrR family transcriptional regulator n=1 Tax=Solihabitans fulvus TaxID=1892852 RepID=A0A5B2XUE5_9PSEU|nr:TetR/AcrR family transcriptional regulator [Solihabitans fulvus]KAA2267126.1 TetR/AcrR family transcriptional regulator [Solihabitans fulvus]